MWLRHEARTKTQPSSEIDRRLAALRSEIREAMGCPATVDDERWLRHFRSTDSSGHGYRQDGTDSRRGD